MTKAKRMMEANLKLVDVVVELLDARIPRSSANPMLQQLIGAKQKIVVLNKTDMADPERTQALAVLFQEKQLYSPGSGLPERQRSQGPGQRHPESRGTHPGKMAEKRGPEPLHPGHDRGDPQCGEIHLINRLLGKNKAAAQNKPG